MLANDFISAVPPPPAPSVRFGAREAVNKLCARNPTPLTFCRKEATLSDDQTQFLTTKMMEDGDVRR